MAKKFKKVVKIDWKEIIEAIGIWLALFGLYHYLMLWISNIRWKLISLGIIIVFALLGIIVARLTAEVYYEEIK